MKNMNYKGKSIKYLKSFKSSSCRNSKIHIKMSLKTRANKAKFSGIRNH